MFDLASDLIEEEYARGEWRQLPEQLPARQRARRQTNEHPKSRVNDKPRVAN